MKISTITPSLYIKKPILRKNNIRQTSCVDKNTQSFSAQIYEKRAKRGTLRETIYPNLHKIKTKIREERQEKIFQQFTKKAGKVSKREYLHIKEKYPFIIDKAYDMVMQDSYAYTLPSEMAKFAVNTKNYLDNCKKLKGKNYCVISIGTSPAPLTEALQNLGCTVIYLPISGIRFSSGNLNTIEKIKNNPNYKLSLEYAKKKVKELNIPKETQFVVLDYAFSRNTLNTVSESIYEKNYITNKKNVWDISLAELMDAIYKKNEVPLKIPSTPELTEQFCEEYNDDLYCSDFTSICNVPHFYLDDVKNKIKAGSVFSSDKNKEELFEEFDKYSKPLGRCYSLCMLEILDSMGEIKCK